MSYILVIEFEKDDPMELPCEEDGTLLLSTLIAQFPEATGLKYKNPETGAFRGIRLNDGKLFPPTETGWGNEKFTVVFPKAIEAKRKLEEDETPTPKTKRLDVKTKCTDLIALGIPWKTTDETLREYFEKFGEIVMCMVKVDPKTSKSKGFGFVRFKNPESQLRVLAQRHNIDGRWCEVQIPNSKEGIIKQAPSKVFVGRITEEMSTDDIKEYFTTYGEVTDVYIPKPFRSFCFVTFLDPDSTEKLWEDDHVIKGVTVHVSDATPKNQKNHNQGGYGRGGYDDYDNNYGGGQDRGGYNSSQDRGYQRRPNFNDRGGSYGGSQGGGGGGRKDWNQGGGGGGNNYRNDDSPQQGLGLPPLPSAIVAALANQWGLMGGAGSENGNSNYGGGKGNGSGPGGAGGNTYDKSYNTRDKFDYGKPPSNYESNDYPPAPPPHRNNYGNNNYSRR